MKLDRELLKGSTNLLVLSVLENENMYGYEMIKKIKVESENVFEFQEGTLYPILYRLEDDKFVESKWSEAVGKKVPRKYYVITKEGREALREIQALWMDINRSAAMIMEVKVDE